MKSGEAGFARGSIQWDLGLELGSQQVACPAQTAEGFVIYQWPGWMSLWHQQYCTEKVADFSNRELIKKTLSFQVCLCHDSAGFI